MCENGKGLYDMSSICRPAQTGYGAARNGWSSAH